MKIYCARQDRLDDDFFQSIVGKDVWVKVKDKEREAPYNILMIRILSTGISRFNNQRYYKCNIGPGIFEHSSFFDDYTDAAIASVKDKVWHCTPEDKTLALTQSELLFDDELELIRPIEALTTDEYFVVEYE